MSASQGLQLSLHPSPSKRFSVPRYEPYYRTNLGAAYLEDADRRIEVLAKDDAGSLGTRPFAWEPEREA